MLRQETLEALIPVFEGYKTLEKTVDLQSIAKQQGMALQGNEYKRLEDFCREYSKIYKAKKECESKLRDTYKKHPANFLRIVQNSGASAVLGLIIDPTFSSALYCAATGVAINLYDEKANKGRMSFPGVWISSFVGSLFGYYIAGDKNSGAYIGAGIGAFFSSCMQWRSGQMGCQSRGPSLEAEMQNVNDSYQNKVKALINVYSERMNPL